MSYLSKPIFMLILSAMTFAAYPMQDSAVDSTSQAKNNSDAGRFVDGIAHTFSSPVRWKGNDWLKVGAALGGTALITTIDKPNRIFWQDRKAKVWDRIERAGYHNGKPYAAFIMTGGFYLTGLVIKNEWARETGLILGSAYLTSGVLQTLMKTAVGRARPKTNLGPWTFDPFASEDTYHSFPSGHSQIATVSALVLGHRVKSPILKALFYSTAGVTMISRMHSDSHWLSDVAFGGAVSWFCTKAVISRMEENKCQDPLKKRNRTTWIVTPTPRGVSLVGTF